MESCIMVAAPLSGGERRKQKPVFMQAWSKPRAAPARLAAFLLFRSWAGTVAILHSTVSLSRYLSHALSTFPSHNLSFSSITFLHHLISCDVLQSSSSFFFHFFSVLLLFFLKLPSASSICSVFSIFFYLKLYL
jgi:hypothetical protein